MEELGAAKAIAKAAESVSDEVGGLVTRAFGPAVDQYGAYWAERAGERLERKRLQKIARRTREKSGGSLEDAGIVNPRVGHRALQEAAYVDDGVVADYWSGLLAAGRSHDGRDDRAIWWSGRIASMSSLQIRLHYLLYREWAHHLHGINSAVISPGTANREPSMYLSVSELTAVLFEPDAAVDHESGLLHAISGLAADDLLANGRTYEPSSDDDTFSGRSGFEVAMNAYPTISGMELYGWAQGFPGMTPKLFVQEAVPFDVEPPLPRLDKAWLPNLGDPIKP